MMRQKRAYRYDKKLLLFQKKDVVLNMMVALWLSELCKIGRTMTSVYI